MALRNDNELIALNSIGLNDNDILNILDLANIQFGIIKNNIAIDVITGKEVNPETLDNAKSMYKLINALNQAKCSIKECE